MTVKVVRRISGTLVGSVPQFRSQVGFAGVPMRLSVEEVLVLVREGFARVVHDAAVDTAIGAALHSPSVPAFRGTVPVLDGVYTRLRARQLAAASAAGSAGANQPGGLMLPPPSVAEIALPQTPLAMRETVDVDALARGLDAATRRRCVVFHDLWRRGFSMTSGSKFGGSYLAYPGSAVEFHAHFVVIVVDADAPVQPLELVALGRLATAVKKMPVLAGVTLHPTDDALSTVNYLCVEWKAVT